MSSRMSGTWAGASEKCASDARPPGARIARIASTGPARSRDVAGHPVAEVRRTRPRRSSRNPAAIIARAIVGRPSASSAAGRARRPGRRSACRSRANAPPSPRSGTRRALAAWRAPPRTPSSCGSTPIPRTWSSPPRARAQAPRTLLISIPGRTSSARPAPRRRELAEAGEGVVVGDARQPDAAAARLAHELARAQDAVGAGRVGVESAGRVSGPAGRADSARPACGRSPAHTSTTRWIRSIASARPVAGSTSTWPRSAPPGPPPPRIGSAARS